MAIKNEKRVQDIFVTAVKKGLVKTSNNNAALRGKWEIEKETKPRGEYGWDVILTRGRRRLYLEVKCTSEGNRDSKFTKAMSAILFRKKPDSYSLRKASYGFVFNRGKKRKQGEGVYFDDYVKRRIMRDKRSKLAWGVMAKKFNAKYVFVIDDKTAKVVCYDWSKFVR